jgi:hypothetical protein
MATTNMKYPERAVKTVFAELNDLEDRISGTYPIYPDSTLNTKYNKYSALTDIADAPGLGYFGIGINGFYNTGDKIQGTPYQPKSNEMDLYQPIPFRCVPIDEDLTTAEMLQYRMRVQQTFNGAQYWCYYLKKLEFIDNSVSIVRIDPATGQEQAYEINSANLYPVPSTTDVSGVTSGAMTEVLCTKRVKAALSGAEVYEAINIMFKGDLTYAKISEWGLYTGVDRGVDDYDAAGVSFRRTEAIYTQMAYKICNTGSVVNAVTWDGSRIFTFGNGKLILQTV